MRLRDLMLGLSLSWGCLGCAGSVPARGGTEAEAPMPASDAPQSIPDRMTVSTNEPFLKARVDGDVLLLTTLQGQRKLKVERNEAVFDGRVVGARDATGVVEVRVTERLCLDSMSGSQHAYTARISVDGGAPVLGCGDPGVAGRGQ